ncbi:JAB1/Mov34/MPN/PAD-1 ubiquitin protease [Nitzschia inconspicua]|uniref:COP9 signalosome complex subunit 5 n=1 Tax=Nitzschia inconspicua TaxID=303405 RepID=A0A9K3KG26_9STRA|nr:JAB1/Mov34/MPN/PAD-1 ubiquitin protease [Nitzschia inconspicua]
MKESESSNKATSKLSPDQRYYAVDTEKLKALQEEKPWMKSAKYFRSVAVSPSAVTKMMMHCASGVEKGIGKGGNPIEVMGLLLGRPDPHSPTTLIVTDAFPLPIEGFETRVIADDQAVVNHMISLNECLERTRNERFMGWYHSHPFDLGELSHCFLSQTDLSTQLQWQRAEDPHGNPFVAIVLDPLRSVHVGTPQLKAFRAYPPEYQSNIANECPDGSVEPSEQARLQRWGSCWNRYYELGVEYYMSSTSRKILGDLTQNYLWIAGFKRRDETQKVKSLQELANGYTTLSSAAGSETAQEGTDVGSTSGAFSVFGAAAAIASHGDEISVASPANQKPDPHVQKLQAEATKELSQISLRQVHRAVFKPPISDFS